MFIMRYYNLYASLKDAPRNIFPIKSEVSRGKNAITQKGDGSFFFNDIA